MFASRRATAADQPHAMRRTKRHVFGGAAAVSVLLCLATAALWARSHHRHYMMILLTHRGGEINANVGKGGLYLAAVPREAAYNFPRYMSVDPAHLSVPTRGLEFAGFGYYTFALGSGTSRVVRLPLWCAAAACALLSLAWWRRARMPAPGRCRTCGYDLRATPDRCPECGWVPPVTEAAA